MANENFIAKNGLTVLGTTTTQIVLPDGNSTRNLGSSTKAWTNMYLGTGSLFVNGQDALTDSGNTIILRASVNNDVQVTTSGSGDVELLASGSGTINLNSNIVVLAAKTITTSNASSLQVGVEVDMNSHKITGLTNPSANSDAVTLAYLNTELTDGNTNATFNNLTATGTLTADNITSATVTVAGALITSASTTSRSGLNLPEGTAPTSPVDGDLWVTASDAIVRVNGVNESMIFGSKSLGDLGDVVSSAVTDKFALMANGTGYVGREVVIADTAGLQTALDARLPLTGGAMTGAITTNSTFDGVDVAAANVLATNALPKTGGAMTGAITTNSTFDGVDIATRDGVLTSTTTTANAALPKAGGAMTGAITTNSTFDGRDVATDGTKLDNIEASADVTDAANVTSAGAAMLAGATFTGDLATEGNMQIDGNLTVSGTSVTIDVTNLAVADNMIYLNDGSTTAHPDLGISGNYNDGTYAHAGLFRDATDGVWKFFDSYTPEPDASAFINIAHGTFALADLSVKALALTGALTTTSTIDGVDIATRDGVLTSTTNTATAALPKAGGAMTGAITTNSTFDGVDIATRDGILTSTTTTANAALPKAGGTITGTATLGTNVKLQFRDTGLYINSSANGQLDIVADTEIQIAATTIDINGAVALDSALTTTSTIDGVDIATRDGVLTSTTTTAGAALPKAGGAMTGAITTNSTFDGVDIASRNGVLTSTTTTANAALPKAGGTMSGVLTMGADLDPDGDNTRTQGAAGTRWANIYAVTFTGTATIAQYADLAEIYAADFDYAPGTVVMFGGEAEITMATPVTTAIAGIISTNPAFLMNSEADGIPVALRGRVPCQVYGPIRKGDLLVAGENGKAIAHSLKNPNANAVLGRALQNHAEGEGIIEVVVS